MKKGRMEAFSDGVIAIIITIMVLEMKVPHGNNLAALKPLIPVFISYVLSFINIGLYWNNHHHMMHVVQHVNGKVLWANTHLLFWLSLVPFSTAWMGENEFTLWPVILYGGVLFFASIAYYILAHTLVKLHGRNSTLAEALGKDKKGMVSIIVYIAAIALAFLNPWFGLALYLLVVLMWIIPDRRIEKKLINQAPD